MDPIKFKNQATIDSIDAALASARKLRRESDELGKRVSTFLSGYSLNVKIDVESGSQTGDKKSSSAESSSQKQLQVEPKLMAMNSRTVRQTSSRSKPSKSNVGPYSAKTTPNVSMADVQRRGSISKSKAGELDQKTR